VVQKTISGAREAHDDFKEKVHRIMKGEGTLGQIVDLAVVFFILLSIAAITIESVSDISSKYKSLLDSVEVLITIVFSAEYIIRLWSSNRRIRHIFKPLYIIDLIAILPSYLSLFFPPSLYTQSLAFRAVRIFRIFRVFKLTRYLSVVEGMQYVLRTKKSEIASIIVLSLIFVFLMGSLAYYVEPLTFGNIPNGMWWALVTIATVGYGDLHPTSVLGKLVASALIYMSVAFIAVPTAIIGSALTSYYFKPELVKCSKCGNAKNPKDSMYCYRCGAKLVRAEPSDFR